MKLLKKILIGGIPAGLMLLIIDAVTEKAGIITYVSNIMVDFKSWMMYNLSLDLMIGLILALVYHAVEKGLEGNYLSKGLLFGVLVWMVAVLPNVLSELIVHKELMLILKFELITGFISYPLAGAVLSFVNERIVVRTGKLL